jgi:hypothetical protein
MVIYLVGVVGEDAGGRWAECHVVTEVGETAGRA